MPTGELVFALSELRSYIIAGEAPYIKRIYIYHILTRHKLDIKLSTIKGEKYSHFAQGERVSLSWIELEVSPWSE